MSIRTPNWGWNWARSILWALRWKILEAWEKAWELAMWVFKRVNRSRFAVSAILSLWAAAALVPSEASAKDVQAAAASSFDPTVSWVVNPWNDWWSDIVKSYVVKKWDTLAKIAKANNTGVNTILWLNPNIENPNHIEVWQEIFVPWVVKTPQGNFSVSFEKPVNSDLTQPLENSASTDLPDDHLSKLNSDFSGFSWFELPQNSWVSVNDYLEKLASIDFSLFNNAPEVISLQSKIQELSSRRNSFPYGSEEMSDIDKEIASLMTELSDIKTKLLKSQLSKFEAFVRSRYPDTESKIRLSSELYSSWMKAAQIYVVNMIIDELWHKPWLNESKYPELTYDKTSKTFGSEYNALKFLMKWSWFWDVFDDSRVSKLDIPYAVSFASRWWYESIMPEFKALIDNFYNYNYSETRDNWQVSISLAEQELLSKTKSLLSQVGFELNLKAESWVWSALRWLYSILEAWISPDRDKSWALAFLKLCSDNQELINICVNNVSLSKKLTSKTLLPFLADINSDWRITSDSSDESTYSSQQLYSVFRIVHDSMTRTWNGQKFFQNIWWVLKYTWLDNNIDSVDSAVEFFSKNPIAKVKFLRWISELWRSFWVSPAFILEYWKDGIKEHQKFVGSFEEWFWMANAVKVIKDNGRQEALRQLEAFAWKNWIVDRDLELKRQEIIALIDSEDYAKMAKSTLTSLASQLWVLYMSSSWKTTSLSLQLKKLSFDPSAVLTTWAYQIRPVLSISKEWPWIWLSLTWESKLTQDTSLNLWFSVSNWVNSVMWWITAWISTSINRKEVEWSWLNTSDISSDSFSVWVWLFSLNNAWSPLSVWAKLWKSQVDAVSYKIEQFNSWISSWIAGKDILKWNSSQVWERLLSFLSNPSNYSTKPIPTEEQAKAEAEKRNNNILDNVLPWKKPRKVTPQDIIDEALVANAKNEATISLITPENLTFVKDTLIKNLSVRLKSVGWDELNPSDRKVIFESMVSWYLYSTSELSARRLSNKWIILSQLWFSVALMPLNLWIEAMDVSYETPETETWYKVMLWKYWNPKSRVLDLKEWLIPELSNPFWIDWVEASVDNWWNIVLSSKWSDLIDFLDKNWIEIFVDLSNPDSMRWISINNDGSLVISPLVKKIFFSSFNTAKWESKQIIIWTDNGEKTALLKSIRALVSWNLLSSSDRWSIEFWENITTTQASRIVDTTKLWN